MAHDLLKADFKHCDDYINDHSADKYLRWWLFINRLPATERHLCESVDMLPKLFAKYQGKSVRLTMASRMGDVGISYDLERDFGYDARVVVSDLTDFRDGKPFS